MHTEPVLPDLDLGVEGVAVAPRPGERLEHRPVLEPTLTERRVDVVDVELLTCGFEVFGAISVLLSVPEACNVQSPSVREWIVTALPVTLTCT